MMNTIKNYILKQVAEKKLNQEDAKAFLLELAQTNQQEVADNDIAVIGMAGRFPKADNVEEFWQLLRDGINCIDEYPQGRVKDAEHVLRNPYYMEYVTGIVADPKDLDDAYAPAGYMKEIDKFDSAFFGIPPNEATYMDPNQRLALEVAWEAMEDAGYGGDTLYGSDTGVYLGREGTNVSQYRYSAKKDPMQLTGAWESIMASRISYLFNFRGPCMLVDTACSGSLVSVHMASKAILSGECSVALAGGVNIVHGELKPNLQGGMSMSSVESEDSMIRTFDADANGTVWGEGVAMVMLKSLKKALEDGDHIHAVIKGSAINNDGASNALTAPNAETQEEVIVKAWKDADIDPESLSYIEAHGTGTVLGDPIEFKGLTNAFRRYTQRKQFCAIGSLKTNMGHLVASSGIASLFKVIKSLQNKEMAPTINFNQPNPYINFAASPLYVSDKRQSWPSNGELRRAAVSSFGFNKTNCHMVVEEAPQSQESETDKTQYCLIISAKKQELLRDYVVRYQTFCHGDDWNLADLCYTAATGRGHYNHRICVVASTKQQLRDALKQSLAVIDGQTSDHIFYGGFTVVSEKKTQRAEGEITEREKRDFSAQANEALSQYIQSNKQNDLVALAQAYCRGAEVNWNACFEGEERHRLSQPTYPFDRVRHWADPKISEVKGYNSALHPLVERRVSQSESEWVYESHFSNETHWVLADHRINETGVVPGTTYLEMARFVAKDALGLSHMELADLFFLQPMVVEANEVRKVRVNLSKHDDEYRFSIVSINAEDETQAWQQHVEGKIRENHPVSTKDTRFLSVQEGAEEFIEEYLSETDTGVFQFGPHWDSIQKAWMKKSEALATLAIPSAFREELVEFAIHPAMLDNAMNLTSQSTGETYLPFMYKSFHLYRPFPESFYSLVTAKTPITGAEETHSYDVVITDLEGDIIAQAEGYITKKVHSFDFSQDDLHQNDYLSTRWIPMTASLSDATKPEGPLLLVSSQHNEIGRLVESLQNQGVEVRHAVLQSAKDAVLPGHFAATADGCIELVNSDVAQDISGIVFAMDYELSSDKKEYLFDSETFGLRRELSTDALFHLCKALLDEKLKLSWGLALVSSAAYAVNDEDTLNNKENTLVNPLAASNAIFALTFAMETSGIDCRVLDTSIDSDPADIAACIFGIPTGKLIALRQQSCFQQELGPKTLAEKEPVQYHDEGVYIVTGGLGGLGLAAAGHIAEQSNANLVLLGRSELPKPDRWQEIAANTDNPKQAAICASLLTLQEQLKSISYISIDVTDSEQVVSLIQSLKERFGRINGVFHAAGIAGDGFILRKSFETFDSVLKPKLEGTVNLLSALKDESVDFITLYSSITALVGGEGQSDYAAANAFMDALVPAAINKNISVNSINWPSWSEVGMSVDFELDTDMTPFTSLTTQEAFGKFSQILANGTTRILPADINPAVFTHVREQLVFELAPELELKFQSNSMVGSNEQSDELIEDLQILGKSEDELSETEVTLATIYANVLGISEIDIFTNFQDMGGNSIIATHLLKVIETQYAGIVDISDIFSYPSVDVMAEYVDEKRGVSTSQATEEDSTRTDGDWQDLMDRLTDEDQSIDSILDEL
ncbi:SDR family NAD(P)-dependent oxidoreductase [Pleionea sp. CnH1-48]|uniref:type I polyketide synthase n=1 Tax=Pleionea sp. CnH1-48 TaxID=2954494 RepID=UPI00209854FD|nr:SDR family NAD(P)-dependent oxidoreductase [Pleionea sp. CnH1-48]MCO7224348.1 SDR family NAD(P)-dependent oxidoreductase [Pleionea sp. CnH1-48]